MNKIIEQKVAELQSETISLCGILEGRLNEATKELNAHPEPERFSHTLQIVRKLLAKALSYQGVGWLSVEEEEAFPRVCVEVSEIEMQ